MSKGILVTKTLSSDDSRREKIVTRSEKFDSTKYWIEHGVDIEKRRIMLDTDIDDLSVGIVIRGIMRMVDASKVEPIDVYISTVGGTCYDALALYDTLRACSYTDIRTHAIGKVMSAGFIIYLAGDHRYASPNVKFMIHEPSCDEIRGRLHEAKEDIKELDDIHKANITILTERTNKTLAWWTKELEYKDRYYFKNKALTLGIVTDDSFEVT